MALAMAGAVGIRAGSPNPLAPRLLARLSGRLGVPGRGAAQPPVVGHLSDRVSGRAAVQRPGRACPDFGGWRRGRGRIESGYTKVTGQP